MSRVTATAGRSAPQRTARFGLTGLCVRVSMLRPVGFGHGVIMSARTSRVMCNPKESVGHDQAP